MFHQISDATSDADLIDLVVAGERSRNSFDAIQALQMLTYVDRARVAGEEFGGTLAGKLEAGAAAHELSLALTLPVATVENQLATARRMRSTMPSLWAGWHTGNVSTRKVTLIDQAAQRLTQSSSVGMLDAVIVEIASAKTPGQLRSWLDRFVERLEAEAAATRHRRARRDRRVWITPVGDGMAWLTAMIPELEAAAIDTRLDSEARSLPSSDPRTFEQARADALCDLLLGAAGQAGGTSTTIGVIVPVQSLMGLSDAPGELADRSASVPADLIRAKAVEPGTLFWRLLTDERGNLLDAAKLSRFAAGNLCQAIRFRDGTSVFPTSVVPADRCDIDHSDSYPAPTTAANLGPLHRRAHNLKTAGLLSMRQPEPGVFQWSTRTGHRYTNTADPLPVAEWEDAAFTSEFIEAVASTIPTIDDLAA